MSVDRNEVARIATLARLRLGGAELDRLAADLNDILAHVEALRALDGVAEASGPERVAPTPTRSEDLEPDPLLLPPSSFAPRWVEGFFVVPPPPGVRAGEDGA